MLEIERKYTLKNTKFLLSAAKAFKITQGYLSSVPERTVRVRTKNDKGFLTIKGKSTLDGLSRFEWEKEIPLEEALSLLNLCEDYVIEKTRYEVVYGNHIFEVDVFSGHNEGLMIAEVELQTEDESIDLPDWIEKEVTGEEKYYNAYLSNHPFTQW